MPSGIFTLKQQEIALGQGAWSNQKPLAVDYLVVAGGGAGGGGYGAGGGGGGLLQGNLPVATGSAITVTVGGGGTASAGAAGTNGSNSVFGSITSTGGGFGPAGQAAGGSGGSGGGSGGNPAGRWGQGVAGQGNRGGDAGSGTGPAPGGGGGAGSRGTDGSGEGPGGTGGAGMASDISGTRTAYAGGGGSGTYLRGASGYNGLGGPGGGGAGGDSNGNNNGIAGTANTGGGGGGASTGGGSTSGGNGGSGIVIISYPDTYAAAASTTGSPTVSTSGSGSAAFNGSTQWITYASNAAWTLGSTFTIEAWVYPTALSVNTKRICQSDAGFDFNVSNSGNVGFNAASTTSTISLNTWTHVAVVCNSGTVSIYFNGVSQTLTGTTTGINVAGTNTLTVGTYQTNSGFAWQGYISNFRIVKNSAVYTSNFTALTAPLTPITNTQLLLNTVSGAYLADSSANSFAPSSNTVAGGWNSASPFATGLGYKNRVYTWTSSGSITF